MKITTPLLLLALSVSLQFAACSKKEDQGIPPAIQAMIKQQRGCLCEPYAEKYTWRSQTIYLFTCGGPACNCATLFYNEEGKQVAMEQGYLPDQFRQEAVFIREIWRCKE